MFSRFAVFSLILITASSAMAHEGHGQPEHTQGILHYVVNPSHAVAGVLSGVIAVAAVWAIRELVGRNSRR